MPGSRWFILTLAMCMAVTALAVDTSLPAFPEIRESLGPRRRRHRGHPAHHVLPARQLARAAPGRAAGRPVRPQAGHVGRARALRRRCDRHDVGPVADGDVRRPLRVGPRFGRPACRRDGHGPRLRTRASRWRARCRSSWRCSSSCRPSPRCWRPGCSPSARGSRCSASAPRSAACVAVAVTASPRRCPSTTAARWPPPMSGRAAAIVLATPGTLGYVVVAHRAVRRVHLVPRQLRGGARPGLRLGRLVPGLLRRHSRCDGSRACSSTGASSSASASIALIRLVFIGSSAACAMLLASRSTTDGEPPFCAVRRRAVAGAVRAPDADPEPQRRCDAAAVARGRHRRRDPRHGARRGGRRSSAA